MYSYNNSWKEQRETNMYIKLARELQRQVVTRQLSSAEHWWKTETWLQKSERQNQREWSNM